MSEKTHGKVTRLSSSITTKDLRAKHHKIESLLVKVLNIMLSKHSQTDVLTTKVVDPNTNAQHELAHQNLQLHSRNIDKVL